MGEVITIGLDIAKSVFQVHGVDGVGAVVIRKRVSRAKMLEFFAGLPRWFASTQPPYGTSMPQSGRRPQHQKEKYPSRVDVLRCSPKNRDNPSPINFCKWIFRLMRASTRPPAH